MAGSGDPTPAAPPGLARAPQLYEQIAELLVGDIRTGVLRPGERLPSERELASRLKVGRSSVREALA
jgi:DNA-binding FadR family transcriptional regulator